jgi:hypothetical protein
MKVCTRCKIEKDESEFSFDTGRNKLLDRCRLCINEYHRIWAKTNDNEINYYPEHKEYIRNKSRENYHKNKHIIGLKDKARRKSTKQELVNMAGGKCSKCGYNKCLSALDFHHKEPNMKEFNISQAMNKRSHTIDQIKQEVLKCVLLCKNCHTELHDLVGYGRI